MRDKRSESISSCSSNDLYVADFKIKETNAAGLLQATSPPLTLMKNIWDPEITEDQQEFLDVSEEFRNNEIKSKA